MNLMAEEDERDLEWQLELQLEEQKESLISINEALAVDPSNTELLSVHEELVLAIKSAEEGLLHLKRSRLLQEVNCILSASVTESIFSKDRVEEEDVINKEVDPLGFQSYPIGSKCRFRHTNGRWYDGQVVGREGDDLAKISFLVPTSENMLMCKFFLQQRCRFGSNCRMSHGLDVPISSLKQYTPPLWQQSMVGSCIWAVANIQSGIWKEAELESWDDNLNLGKVVFREDGCSATRGVESLSISEYALMSDDGDYDDNDDDDDDRSSEISDDDDDDVEDGSSAEGLGFLDITKSQRGIQTETAVFAKWENHTRGIASKMMANMGYREGMGLGISGQGILNPVSVKVLPPKQSLDHAINSSKKAEETERDQTKKRTRGGKRKRGKKFAALARAAKEEQNQLDVFNFINNQLATQGENENKAAKKSSQSTKEIPSREENRRSLVAYDDEIKDLKNKAEKLKEMVERNRKDKVIYEAALRKLNETKKALADAEVAHASASNAVVSKEKEKKWLKF